jgi:hypothetical protein
MMPHLGVLSSVAKDAAVEIFLHDCLVNIAHALVPVFPLRRTMPDRLAEVFFEDQALGEVRKGKLEWISDLKNKEGTLVVKPSHRLIDVGAGPGQVLERKISLGQCGLLIDGRGRPLAFSEDVRETAREFAALYEEFGLQGRGRE